MARGIMLRGRSNSLPVLCVSGVARAIDCRRNGLGNIFSGQRSDTIHTMTNHSKTKFQRSFSTCADSLIPAGHYTIRYNLTSDDFEIHDELFGLSEDDSCTSMTSSDWCSTFDGDYPLSAEREYDLDTTLGENINSTVNHTSNSLDQSLVGTRRLALADIFENVGQDRLLELLAIYSGSAVNELGQHYRNTRRNGVADVYEDISAIDLKMFLESHGGIVMNGYTSDGTGSSSDEAVEEQEPAIMYRRDRRNALGDIYDGVGREAVESIAGETDEVEEEAKLFNYQSRRMGLANIKQVVSSSDISKLRDTYSEAEVEQSSRCRARRSALADIYSEMDTEEMESFLKRLTDETDIDSE